MATCRLVADVLARHWLVTRQQVMRQQVMRQQVMRQQVMRQQVMRQQVTRRLVTHRPRATFRASRHFPPSRNPAGRWTERSRSAYPAQRSQTHATRRWRPLHSARVVRRAAGAHRRR
jgi:hypothetical protein